jgi:putative membrane protein
MSYQLPRIVKVRFIPRTAMGAWLCLGSAGYGETQASVSAQAPQTTFGAVPVPLVGPVETSAKAPTKPVAWPANGSFVNSTATFSNSGSDGATDPSTGRSLGAQASSSADADVVADSQIAQIADAANEAELEQGRYAVLHATDGRVKQFAQHMVSAHGNMGENMSAMLQNEAIVPARSAQSSTLTAEAHQTFEALRSKSSSEFDKAYIDAQVKAHQAVLVMFDGELIPGAKDAALKANLQHVRPMVADDLADALRIQQALRARH